MLYGCIDYLIMISIIAAVVLIIGWRLDILFQKDVLASVTGDEIRVENPKVEKDHVGKNEEVIVDKLPDDEETIEAEKIEEIKPVEIVEEANNIKINIPDGALPGQIGSILQTKGLVANSSDFTKKAVELKLDTKLKSGSFIIPDNASIDTVVQIISKQKPSN